MNFFLNPHHLDLQNVSYTIQGKYFNRLHAYLLASTSTAPKPTFGSVPIINGEASEKKEEKKELVTAQDHISAAADLLSDIQVETYSSMDKREKTEL